MSDYATEEKVSNLTTQVNKNVHDIEVLNDALTQLGYSTQPDKLAGLKDVSLDDTLTDGDLLQYTVEGTWKNIKQQTIIDKAVSKDTVLQLIESRGSQLYLSKTANDTANGLITFKKGINTEANISAKDGITLGNYVSTDVSPVGGYLDKDGVGNLKSLTLRESLNVPTIDFNKITVTGGETWHCVCCGEIESVDTATNTITLKLAEGEYSGIAVNDICKGIYHYENDDNNSEETVDECGFPRYSGFTTVYFSVSEVTDSVYGKTFKYILRSGQTSVPTAHMKFVVYGNFTDEDRQASEYQTRTYTRYLKGVNTWAITSSNIASQFGDLNGLHIEGAPGGGDLVGQGAYLDNVYLTGAMIKFTPEQIDEFKGKDAYAVNLTATNYTVLVKKDMSVITPAKDITTTVSVLKGTTELAYTAGTMGEGYFTITCEATGITYTQNENTITVDSITDVNNMSLKIKVNCEGEGVITKEFVLTWDFSSEGQDGAYQQYIYKLCTLDETPSTPTGDTPDGWSFSTLTPDSTQRLWMSQRTVNSDKTYSTWSAPVVFSGTDGKDGEKGEDGKDGTNGKDGVSPTITLSKDGKVTTITVHNADGTESTQQVNDGVDGTAQKGEKGDTTYFHVKYSDDGGVTFTGNEGEDVGKWLGSYTDTTLKDSTNVGDYKWVKIKGEDGEDGKDGTAGEKGEKGDKGDTGEKGDTGAAGKDGTDGTNGVDGKDGENGSVFMITPNTVQFIANKNKEVSPNSAIFTCKRQWLDSTGTVQNVAYKVNWYIKYSEDGTTYTTLSTSTNTTSITFTAPTALAQPTYYKYIKVIAVLPTETTDTNPIAEVNFTILEEGQDGSAADATYTMLRSKGVYDSEKTYYYELASTLPSGEADEFVTQTDASRCYIRDYVTYNGAVYMVKSVSVVPPLSVPESEGVVNSYWVKATSMELLSVNTLLANEAKLGNFNFSNNTFTSSNGKLSMNSETGKLVAEEAEIKNSTFENISLKNIIYTKKQCIIYYDVTKFVEINEDGTTYSYYNNTTTHNSSTLVSTNAICSVGTGVITLTSLEIQPEHCTVFSIKSIDSSQTIILRLPLKSSDYYGTEITINKCDVNSTGKVRIIRGTDEPNDDGCGEFDTDYLYERGPNYIGFAKPTITGSDVNYTFTANDRGWLLSKANTGTCTEKIILSGNLYFDDSNKSFEVFGYSALFETTSNWTVSSCKIYGKNDWYIKSSSGSQYYLNIGAEVALPFRWTAALSSVSQWSWILNLMRDAIVLHSSAEPSSTSVFYVPDNSQIVTTCWSRTSDPSTRANDQYLLFNILYFNYAVSTVLPTQFYIPFTLQTTSVIYLP